MALFVRLMQSRTLDREVRERGKGGREEKENSLPSEKPYPEGLSYYSYYYSYYYWQCYYYY